MPIKVKKQIEYLLNITDKTGLIEHCVGDKPDYKEGWCVDDNARAVQVALRYRLDKKIVDTYFEFLKKAWIEGKLFNDLNQDLTWEKDFLMNGEHSGRVLWALGEMIENGYRTDEAKDLFDKIYRLIKKNEIEFPRVMAQIILGLQFYKIKELSFWADKLVKKYEKTKDNKWQWFEDTISYDNGRLPMALLTAYQVTNQKKYLIISLEALDFLTELIWDNEKKCFSFPGNKGWFLKTGFRAKFDQQPIEAGSMVEVYMLAYEITNNKKYFDLAKKTFGWYQGRNILGLSMVNKKTGGIFDGFNGDRKINLNQGAESVLSYLTAAKKLANN